MDKPTPHGDPGPRRAGGFVRAFRDHYAARFAGLTYDLAPDAVGLPPEALEAAPELAGRRVLVTVEGRTAWPLHARPSFLVVPLDRLMRNARGVADAGGVVFSSFALEDPGAATLLETLGVGDAVFLNAAMGRLPRADVRRPYQDDAAA